MEKRPDAQAPLIVGELHLRYYEALQRDADVVLAHGTVTNLLGATAAKKGDQA